VNEMTVVWAEVEGNLSILGMCNLTKGGAEERPPSNILRCSKESPI
jgi:hypothetical protein